MALPDESATVTGGCSCGAIRYRIAIPPLQDRQQYPLAPSESGVRFPQVLTCHCNDCRRSTGCILPTIALDVSNTMLTVSAIAPSSESTIASGRIMDALAEDYDQQSADAQRPLYVPSADVLIATDESKTWVRYFHTSDCGPAWSRSFCGRCGTELSFHMKLQPEFCPDGKVPEGMTDLFHLNLGCIDRKFLDLDWFVPSTEFCFKYATPLTKRISETAEGLKDLPKLHEFS